jgi:hypothetical protein
MTIPHPGCHRPTANRPDEDAASDTSIVRLPRWPFARLFGSNPLVRISDLVEALVVVLAVLMVIIAVPIAAGVGTAVYDSRSRQYAEQAETSQVVTGTVTSHKVAYHESLGPTITVLARWFAGGTEHTGAVSAPPGVNIGDSIDIWVDGDGSHVGPPPKTAHHEAVAAGSAVWFGVAIAAGILVAGARAALNRARHARWQDDFDDLIGDGDGHTSQP